MNVSISKCGKIDTGFPKKGDSLECLASLKDSRDLLRSFCFVTNGNRMTSSRFLKMPV